MSCSEAELCVRVSLDDMLTLLLVRNSSHPTADYINEYMEYYTNRESSPCLTDKDKAAKWASTTAD